MFDNDLKIGEMAEDYVAEKLEEVSHLKFKKVSHVGNNYDLESEKGTKIEVKYDKMWKKTGNIALEVGCMVYTDADYITYLLYPDVYIAKAKTVRDHINDFKIINGGDGNRTKLCLIPLTEFKKLFRKIN